MFAQRKGISGLLGTIIVLMVIILVAVQGVLPSIQNAVGNSTLTGGALALLLLIPLLIVVVLILAILGVMGIGTK